MLKSKTISVNDTDIARALFPTLTFLTIFTIIFDIIVASESLSEESITDVKVKDSQRKSLYISIIPGIMSAFVYSNTIGILLFIVTITAKFFYTTA